MIQTIDCRVFYYLLKINLLFNFKFLFEKENYLRFDHKFMKLA